MPVHELLENILVPDIEVRTADDDAVESIIGNRKCNSFKDRGDTFAMYRGP
jgi:hypothetical protein